MTAPLDANEVRKDFELAMTLGIEGVSIEGYRGCLERDGTGRYFMPEVQAAWLGYIACASHEHAQRERLSATRYMGAGDVAALRFIMTRVPVGPHSEAEAIREFARAILKHFEGMPT